MHNCPIILYCIICKNGSCCSANYNYCNSSCACYNNIICFLVIILSVLISITYLVLYCILYYLQLTFAQYNIIYKHMHCISLQHSCVILQVYVTTTMNNYIYACMLMHYLHCTITLMFLSLAGLWM